MEQMNRFPLLFLAFIGFFFPRSEAAEIHLFLPGLQYRYENGSDQMITNHQYQNYNIAGIIFKDYLVGFEMNQFQQDSSSGSISIEEKFQEFSFYAGYFVLSQLLNEEYKIIFDLGPVAYFGQSRSTVETTIGGAPSVKSVGEANITYSGGVQGTLRIGYVLIQPEARYAYSRASQPTWVPIYGARLGFRIPFN